ncbi:MAG TPA: AI-2E family transporter [Alphaproteobacteria bacterium]|nr:AI-2E family transporter [Alphaproteobacteria bacterium]
MTPPATLTASRRVLLWSIIALLIFATIWLLSPVLFPFLVGLAIAYLLDPLVDRVERWGIGRTVATSLVMAAFFIVLAVAVVLLAPVLYDQLRGLSIRVVRAAEDLMELLRPYIETYLQTSAPDAAGGESIGMATQALRWAGGFAGQVISGGLAVFNLLSLLFITPVVAFYLMRDWDRIVATMDLWLPRDQAPVIRKLLQEIDCRMAGFLRGQALVCLLLGVFYAIGLTLVGLQYGLIIGLLTGLVSFVPYIGMLLGAGIGLTVAFFQFDSWLMVAVVLGVFIAGQFIEGNFVSPILVGDRVGLHPVWLMLAVLAGGALLGFVGVLIAVPAAAAIAVLLRYALERYMESPLYRGPATAAPPPLAGKDDIS